MNVETPTVDVDSFRRAVDDGMPDWAEFREMRLEVQACKAERLARERRRNWMRATALGGVGTFIAATVFVVRALLSAGAAAESSRAQALLIRDTADLARRLEILMTVNRTRLDILFARPGAPTE